jgi:hypothetical protein
LLLLANFGHDAEHQSKHVLDAFNEVEWITIFFFVGLFIVVHGVDSTGLLKLLADKMLALTGGDLTATAMVILWSSAMLSAIIDNIPFVATMIPLIKAMAPTFGGPEGLMPLWWALSLGACLGGNGTLIGASANLVVAGFAERAGQPIRFMRYTLVAFPIMLMSIQCATARLVGRTGDFWGWAVLWRWRDYAGDFGVERGRGAAHRHPVAGSLCSPHHPHHFGGAVSDSSARHGAGGRVFRAGHGAVVFDPGAAGIGEHGASAGGPGGV